MRRVDIQLASGLGQPNRESTPQHRDVPTVAIDQGNRDATARFNVQCSSYLFICAKKLNGGVFSLLPLYSLCFVLVIV